MAHGELPVVVIGGGVTGTGVVRDLALRGIPCVLIEQGDLATGTSGRNHGLLHSGARYAVRDAQSAAECLSENRILKEIAPRCIEDTGGVFIALKNDDKIYMDQWLSACENVGIPADELSPRELRREVPLLTSHIDRAWSVPDAAIDGFLLARANAISAEKAGARVKTYTRAVSFQIENRKVTGIHLRNLLNGREELLECAFVVNASGPWAGEVSKMAGQDLPILCDRGILVAFHYRFTNRVLNRLRPPADGDIFVPHGSVTIFGTSSKTVDDPGNTGVEQDEVIELLQAGEEMIPGLCNMRIIRAFAGVRPLMQSGGTGREATREFTIIDHGSTEGVANMISLIGGKLTTFRLMAQKSVDRVAVALQNDKPCLTDEDALPDPLPVGEPSEIVCECEQVTKKMLDRAIKGRENFLLSDARRLTRLGMGPCQGSFCTFRAAGYYDEKRNLPTPHKLIIDDINERWKGEKPVLWGWQARQTELMRRVYLGLLCMERLSREET